MPTALPSAQVGVDVAELPRHAVPTGFSVPTVTVGTGEAVPTAVPVPTGF